MKKLPLLSSWHMGTTTPAFGPELQLKLLGDSVPIMPWMQLPEKYNPTYYRELMKEASAQSLPICFKDSQWERKLSEKPYFDKTEDNPNCQKLDGTYERKLSPFGNYKDWRSVGKEIGNRDALRELHNIYRDPPEVIFLSNNEHPRLRWRDVNNYLDFTSRHSGANPNTTREILADRYQNLYSWLFHGIKTGDFTQGWPIKCVGYNSFAPQFTGRYVDWEKYSYHHIDNCNPWINSWDGASCNYYTDANGCTDHTLMSTQVEFMNLVQELEDNPKFYFELSIWNGGPDQIKKYRDAGEVYNEDRYEGWAQYGLWLTRPRVLRPFYPHTDQFAPNETYFNRLIDIIKRTHEYTDDLNLPMWYMYGELLKFDPHPYRFNTPDGWKAYSYMKLPPYNKPKDLTQNIDVFYLCFRMGPQYMVYAHSPLKVSKATIPLPIGDKEIEVGPQGGFFHF